MTADLLHHYHQEFERSRDIAEGDAEPLFDAINAESDETRLAGLLSAWNRKGIAEEELYQFSRIMRGRMKRISTGGASYVDTVGTGGSKAKTFNVSTAAAFVIAGADVAVAKHGNRAATSSSGSSDVLARLGVSFDIDPDRAQGCLDEHGICFLFAPRFHDLSPVLARARRMTGQPTIFNNLGPLCNPASVPHHVIGVADERMFEMTARVLQRLGTRRSWIVRGEEGLDEISIVGKTQIMEINGGITNLELTPDKFGVSVGGDDLPKNCSAEESAHLIREILGGQQRNKNAEKLVLINAAAAIYVAGGNDNIISAYGSAAESLRSGAAMAKLEAIVTATSI